MLLKDEIFLVFAPRKVRFLRSEFTKYYTKMTVTLPDNLKGYFCSKYGDDIERLGFFVFKTDKKYTEKNEAVLTTAPKDQTD